MQIDIKYEYVYHYDGAIYNELKKSFILQDFEMLEREWQKAIPILT
jgi:hypothetical protein